MSECRVIVQREPLKFCRAEKKAWQLVCLDHWQQLPKVLQDEVWRQYKSAKGSAAHLAAINECYRFLHAPADGVTA